MKHNFLVSYHFKNYLCPVIPKTREYEEKKY